GRSFLGHASRRIFLSSTRTRTRAHTHATVRTYTRHARRRDRRREAQQLQSCKRRRRSPIYAHDDALIKRKYWSSKKPIRRRL
ncbi:Uncharacterized protein FWK35_00030071, partial [Aphis craccivora]